MDRLLRPAFGNQELGKLVEDVEGAVPTLAPVLDLVFGNRPEAKERHDPAWWAQQRPRPYRGATVDPSGPAKKREEYMLKFEIEKAKLENEARIGTKADEEKKSALQDKARKIFEQQSAMEAENQRIGFFGRPAQKQRLLKRERQVEIVLLAFICRSRGYMPLLYKAFLNFCCISEEPLEKLPNFRPHTHDLCRRDTKLDTAATS